MITQDTRLRSMTTMVYFCSMEVVLPIVIIPTTYNHTERNTQINGESYITNDTTRRFLKREVVGA